MTTKETPTDVQPKDKKWTTQIATGAERETQKTRNTYEKLTCWRMLQSHVCTFLLHPSGFVFCFSSLFPFQCPLFSLSCYVLYSLGAFCSSFEKRKDQSRPKYTKVPKKSILKYTIIYHSTNNTRTLNNNSADRWPVPSASDWPWDPWDPWASHLYRPPAVREATPWCILMMLDFLRTYNPIKSNPILQSNTIQYKYNYI